MLGIGQELLFRDAVSAELVGDEDARHIVQTLQKPLEEALRRQLPVAVTMPVSGRLAAASRVVTSVDGRASTPCDVH